MTLGPLLLGIDLGTSSVKVLLSDAEGRVEGRAAADYAILRPGPGRAEQDPEAWWAAVRGAVRAAVGATGEAGAAGRVLAIGLSGQMHGTVLADRAGRAVRDAIIWPDQRSRAEVAELAAALGAGRVRDAVGGPLATGFQAPTVRWLRRHEPDRWSRAAFVLLPKDWLRLRLTGEVATDPSDGSGTGFLDERARSWWPPMLEAVGIDEGALPPVVDSTSAAGRLLADPARELGLPAGIVVAVGGGDTPCGLLGAGLVDPDALLFTLSTGGQIAVPSLDATTDPLGRSHTFCAALPPAPHVAGWYRMAAILSAGVALRWLRDAVLGLADVDDYERMASWAAGIPVGARGLLFLPYLTGERSPHMDPEARACFVGLTARHGRADLIRAVMEGVAMAGLDAALSLGDLGPLPGALVLGGGGARSELWATIVADVFERPVRRLRTEEQAAMGACLLAGAAAGLLDPASSARRWAALAPPIEPDQARARRYAELFGPFRETYRASAPILHSLARAAVRDEGVGRAGKVPNGPPGHPLRPVPGAGTP